MKIKAEHFLYAINVVTALLSGIIVFSPDNVARIVFGLPAVLFLPGYTLLAALFPRKESFKDVERFALSFGLSVVVAPLLALVLNYLQWGIRLYPILISLSIFIFVMSVIGWFRNRELLPEERIALHINIKIKSPPHLWSGQSRGDKMLTIVLVVLVTMAIGGLIYVIKQPRNVENFTEFYILNDAGQIENYPGTIIMGQSANVILGVINHENETTTYKIEITLAGKNIEQDEPFTLTAEEEQEQEFTVTPYEMGDKQELEFLLYKGEDSNVYESLHLWLNVIP